MTSSRPPCCSSRRWRRASRAGRRLAWLTLDAIGVTDVLATELRAAVRLAVGDPELTVLIVASHSHSAPLGWTGSIHPGSPGARSLKAVDELVARVAELARSVAHQRAVSRHAGVVIDPRRRGRHQPPRA